MKEAKSGAVTRDVTIDSEEEEENKKTANLLTTYFSTIAAREIDYTGARKEPQIWASIAGF